MAKQMITNEDYLLDGITQVYRGIEEFPKMGDEISHTELLVNHYKKVLKIVGELIQLHFAKQKLPIIVNLTDNDINLLKKIGRIEIFSEKDRSIYLNKRQK